MLCSKCNHTLPDDSTFCQYCGKKLETTDETDVPNMPDFDSISSKDALKTVFEIQAQETLKAMAANRQSQPESEGDADFGLVPEKPIYTFAIKSVNGEEEYLNKLYTENGEKITWNRRGSIGVNGIHGIIDIYDTFLPSGQFYKTIYINMYGAKTSNTAPKGFVLRKKIMYQPTTHTNTVKGINNKRKKYTDVFNMLTMALSAIATVCILVALNVQDVKRNQNEDISPTLLYFVLLGFYGIYLMFSVLAQKQVLSIAHNIFGVVPSIFTMYALLEGSLFSETYKLKYLTKTYSNSEIVFILNLIWVLISFIILLFSVLQLTGKVKSQWRTSIGYREKCYNRVAKMKQYLDQGIISQEEFEKNKKEILKNIRL